MQKYLVSWFAIVTLIAAFARAEAPPRPDLTSVEPVAKCKLQSVAGLPKAENMPVMVVYSLQPPPDDPLANYERTPLGDWQMPADADRNDPWLRFVLLAPKRPVVIDLAVFIDGKAFREQREAWIDDVLTAAKSGATDGAAEKPAGNKVETDKGTKTAEATSEEAAPAEEAFKGEAPEPAPPEKAASEEAAPEKPASDDATPEATAPAGAKTESKTDDATTEDAESEDAKSGAVKPESAKAEDAKDEDTKSEDEKAEDAKPPGVPAQARQAPTMRERLITYLTAAGTDVQREEVGWLLAESGSGPAVVVLAASQAWQRAGVAPLENYLDQDLDGTLSAIEIEQVDSLLKQADMDGDDVVDVSEIRRSTKHPAAIAEGAGHSLVVLLDANTDWDSLAATLGRIYPGNPSMSSKEALSEIGSKPADVTLRVDFSTAGDDKKSGEAVSVVSVSPDLATDKDAVSATTDVIAMDLGGDSVEFSAAQSPAGDTKDVAAGQIAIGAVLDGNPLLRLLDRDQDGRLTLRERHELSGLLAALDKDSDGQVIAAEMPVPIRLAVTLGPQVHQLLAKATGAARSIALREVEKAPDWFSSMDKNKDSDLSRGEFLGTTEQFRQFDGNADGLLSVAEALKLDGAQ